MKNTKKFAAMIAALTLTACSVAPMFSSAASVKITIPTTTDDDNENYGIEHTYAIYQIFTGNYKAGTPEVKDEEGNVTTPATKPSLESLKWGASVSNKTAGDIVAPTDEAYKTLVEGEGSTDREIIKNAIGKDKAIELADTPFTTAESKDGVVTLNDLADGYYYIVDTTTALKDADGTGIVETDDVYDAKSAIMVQIIGGEVTTEINTKKARPSIDKQISDNDDGVTLGDNNGYGETADHAINETFQFKLTATIPADEDLKAYDTYYLAFCDTFSSGVTFESFDTLKINGTTIMDKNDTEKPFASTTNWTVPTVSTTENGGTFTFSATDIKTEIPSTLTWGEDEITVELVYSAHLNEGAKFFKTGTDENGTDTAENNYVSLKYSNNPEETGDGDNNTGETPKDYVWAFTYGVDNNKVDATDNTKKLAGAKFTLSKGEETINVKKVVDSAEEKDEEGKVTKAEVYHYVVCKADETPDVIESSADGTFNIVGLDAGTYTLTETEAPEGYATPKGDAAKTNFTITATHEEVKAGTAAVLTLGEKNETPVQTIENSFTTSLPSTGGMGTTLFYLGGGAMVAVAGVFLITKKRMGKSEN